jgi:hypothetical protein
LARATQVVPLQQPAQVPGPQPAPVQTPLWQTLLPVHAAHAAPLVPHWELLWLATAMQLLPLQQPAQLLGPQGVTQTPLVQVLVPVQATQVAPLVPH